MTTGLERRNEGWSAVQAADVAPHRNYGKVIRRALDQCIQLGEPFTSDDVDRIAREMNAIDIPGVGRAYPPHSPNLIGSIIGNAARTGRITRTGNRRRSTHPSRNAAYNAEWKAAQ